MSTNESTATKRDVYEHVTSQIVNAIRTSGEQLAHAVAHWQVGILPHQRNEQKALQGINTVCPWAAAQAKGDERGEWATYQQWQERGAQVRKGEKATLVVFWKFANNAHETDDGDDTRRSGSHLLFTRVIPYSMPLRWTATPPK